MRIPVCLLLTTAMLLSGRPVVAQETDESHAPSDNAALNYYQASSWYEQVFQPMSERSCEKGWQLQARLFGGRINWRESAR